MYDGAPLPITAFMSASVKTAAFAVFARVMIEAMPGAASRWHSAMWWLAVVTMVAGNVSALSQKNLVRLLAYSSIAHAGYLLIALAAIGNPLAGRAVVFYLSGYLLMTFLAFLILVPVTKANGGDDISHFNGLARRSPGLALAMLVAAASLAGLPFTVGFFGKFFIFEAAMEEGLYLLVLIGVVTVASGFYYYFKVIRAMYWQPAAEDGGPVVVSPLSKLAIATCG